MTEQNKLKNKKKLTLNSNNSTSHTWCKYIEIFNSGLQKLSLARNNLEATLFWSFKNFVWSALRCHIWNNLYKRKFLKNGIDVKTLKIVEWRIHVDNIINSDGWPKKMKSERY